VGLRCKLANGLANSILGSDRTTLDIPSDRRPRLGARWSAWMVWTRLRIRRSCPRGAPERPGTAVNDPRPLGTFAAQGRRSSRGWCSGQRTRNEKVVGFHLVRTVRHQIRWPEAVTTRGRVTPFHVSRRCAFGCARQHSNGPLRRPAAVCSMWHGGLRSWAPSGVRSAGWVLGGRQRR
jgi:hypothetical protein